MNFSKIKKAFMFKKLPKQKVIILEEIFRESRYPNLDERRKLAERLDISESKVKNWFQNRRAKLSQKRPYQPSASVYLSPEDGQSTNPDSLGSMAANGHQTHTYVIAANGSAIADVAAQNQVTSPIMGSDDGDFNQRRSSGESDSQQFHMIHHPNHQNHHHQQMNHQRQNVFSERSIDHINHGIDMKQGQPQMVCTSATANFHYNPQELAEMSEEKRQEMLMLMELELIISKNIAEGLV